MKAKKESHVWVTYPEAEKEKVRIAASIAGVPMSQFVKEAGLRKAEKILEKFSKNP